MISSKAVIFLAVVTAAAGQTPPDSVSIRTPAPEPVSGSGAQVVGFSGQGSTLYYWVIARYVSGTSSPYGPVVVSNTPGAGNLSASRYVSLSWNPADGATGYDVLRNTTSAFPAAPSCTACAIVLNTPLTTAQDTGAAALPYPPAGLSSAQSTLSVIRANGRDYTVPVLFVDRQPGGTDLLPTVTGSFPTPGHIPVFTSNGRMQSMSVPASCPTCEQTTNKNVAGGYAGLDATGRVPFSEVRETERYSWILCGGIPCVTGADQANHVLVARTNTITACYAQAKTAPTGADIRIVINRQGVDNIFTTFLSIPAGSTSVVTETGFSAAASLSPAQYLTIDMTQVGTTQPGQDVSVTCVGSRP